MAVPGWNGRLLGQRLYGGGGCEPGTELALLGHGHRVAACRCAVVGRVVMVVVMTFAEQRLHRCHRQSVGAKLQEPAARQRRRHVAGGHQHAQQNHGAEGGTETDAT